MPVTLDSIRAAHSESRTRIYRSPCVYSLSLSGLCGARFYCKFDHLQMTGSFKERGARNKLLQVTDTKKRRGVIAAYGGKSCVGRPRITDSCESSMTVVMPKWAPLVKVRFAGRLR